MNATCATCPYWTCDPADRKAAAERECRVRPPASCWTDRDDWCSEHPLRQLHQLAARAMEGILAFNGMVDRPDRLAADAYYVAEAMIAEAERRMGAGKETP